MSPTPISIAVRAYVDGVAAPPSRKQRNRPPMGPSDVVLIFDTETTIDAAQRLRFGVYQVRRGEMLDTHGVFYNPDVLSKSEQVVLLRYARTQGLTVLSVSAFIEDVFFAIGYELRATIVGFNLPFDLSRLACKHGSARRQMRGGFTLGLSANPWRPRVQVKHLSRSAALIQFAGVGQPASRGMRKRFKRVPIRRGYFVDVKTLGAALTSDQTRWPL